MPPKPKLDPNIVKKINEAYGIRIGSIQEYDTPYRKKAAFMMTSGRRSLLLKPFIGPVSKLATFSSFVRRLEKCGFRQMPRWLKTRTGKRWVLIGGKPYYVTRWVHGRTLGAETGDLYRFGGALARLHTQSRRMRLGPARADFRGELESQYRLFLRQLASVQGRQSTAGHFFAEHGSHCKQLCEEAWAIMRKSHVRRVLLRERRRAVLIHGDLTVLNVVVAEGRIYLIDWETAGPGSGLFELAKVLTNTTSFEPSRMEALLRGYADVRSLSRGERRLVSAFFRIPREAWYACLYAHAKGHHPLVDVVKNTWSQRLAAVGWLDAWSKS